MGRIELEKGTRIDIRKLTLDSICVRSIRNPYRPADRGIFFIGAYDMNLAENNIWWTIYGTKYLRADFRGGNVVFAPWEHGAYGWVFQTSNAALDAALTRLVIEGGVDVGRIMIRNAHLDIPAEYNILGRAYAGTAKTVTETSATLKDSVGPVAPKNVLYPLSITVDANNPTGSLVTLYVELRLYHSDGTETVVDSFTVAEGATVSKSYTPDVIAKAFKDGASVVEVRLYAWCSATPATGYEPTVTLTEVKGIQF